MAHALAYVLLNPDPRNDENVKLWSLVDDAVAAYADASSVMDVDDYLLSSDDEPDDIASVMVTWRMSHRQARLMLSERLSDADSSGLTADLPLERLAELAQQTAEYRGETYSVDGDDIVGVSSVQPAPMFSAHDIGGVWTDVFALPPRAERPDIQIDCSTCKGKGEIPPKEYLLPRFLRLSAEARRDPGVPTPCARCSGIGHFVTKPTIDDAPAHELIKTPQEAIEIMDDADAEGLVAIVDLKGRWHGGEATVISGVVEETGDPTIPTMNLIRDILRAAPKGTVVVPVDILM